MPGQGDVLKLSGNAYTSSPTTTVVERHRDRPASLHEICHKGLHAELEKRLLDDIEINECFDDGSTPLTISAYYGHARSVKLLLRYGAQVNMPNKRGDQALQLAVKRNHLKIVAYLLDYGADVNSKGASGLCPIHIAAKRGNDIMLRVLLGRGARMDKYTDTTNRQHALHLAAARGHVNCIKVLLEVNNFTEPRDNFGRTPLYMAVMKGKRDAVWQLAISKANVNATDFEGKIPLQVAIETDNEDICHTLCEHGADVSLRYSNPRKEDTQGRIVDRYGIVRGKSASDLVGDITKMGEEAKALQFERKSVKQWERMIKYWVKYSRFKKEKLKKRLVRGVPDCLRGQVWKLFCKLKYNVESHEYKELRQKDSTHTVQIDLDVGRAFRDHEMFQTRYGKGQCALFNLLKAYSNFDTTLGYCQGMAEMAALLLKYLPEREAFSVLDVMMKDEKYNMRSLYLPGFPKLQQVLFVHEKLFEEQIPKLYEHFQKLDVSPALYATKWYLTAFLDIFSYEVTLRIWDLLFMDGYDVLYSVALGVLAMYQDKLLGMKFDQLVMFMHALHEQDINVNEFITYVTGNQIRAHCIRKYVRMHEDVIRRQKLAALQLQKQTSNGKLTPSNSNTKLQISNSNKQLPSSNSNKQLQTSTSNKQMQHTSSKEKSFIVS